jgi:uncharacterized protein
MPSSTNLPHKLHPIDRQNGLEIEVAGEHLTLLPQRAIYWRATKTLFVADTHWGKGATFRASAIPIPGGTMQKDLATLSSLLVQTKAERLVVLGDLVHARLGKSAAVVRAVSDWRQQHVELAIDLILGNHDLQAGELPDEWRIARHAAPLLNGPFALQHFPDAHPTHYVLAGHLHPAVRLHGPAKESLRLDCFHATGGVLVLPAFCSFAGAAIVTPTSNDCVYAIADDTVFLCEFATNA